MLPGVFFREKTIFLPFATIAGAVLNVILNILFIPSFGIIGAAYSTIAAYALMVFVLYFVSKYIYMVNYELGRLGLVFLFTLIPVGISYLYYPDGLFMKFFYNFALCCIPPAAYYFSGFLKKEEKKLIYQIAGKFISRQ